MGEYAELSSFVQFRRTCAVLPASDPLHVLPAFSPYLKMHRTQYVIWNYQKPEKMTILENLQNSRVLWPGIPGTVDFWEFPYPGNSRIPDGNSRWPCLTTVAFDLRRHSSGVDHRLITGYQQMVTGYEKNEFNILNAMFIMEMVSSCIAS